MDIAFHIGAHGTDDDLLLNCLRHNAGLLARKGVIVPAGEVYRPIMRDAIRKLQGAEAEPDEEESLLELVLKGMSGKRLVMSSENFICIPQRVFDEGVFYNKMGHKSVWLRNVFPEQRVSFFLAIRNPAAFIPELYLRRRQGSFEDFLDPINMQTVEWSRVIATLADAVPDCAITVWCAEDAPLIWPEVMSALAGLENASELERTDVHLRSIMKPEGLRKLKEYIERHPEIAVSQRRWATISFLDKYAKDSAMEDSYDLPGWTQDRIESLTEAYEADMEIIADLPGVTMIQP
ncbi:MAG: hypothetical protein QNI90_19135 [Dinoroseobacter sp.]|nr:hypothetical protein [Dinoroseobacter sp.]